MYDLHTRFASGEIADGGLVVRDLSVAGSMIAPPEARVWYVWWFFARHIHSLEETNGQMYNPDFWEVQLDQSDLERMPDDVGLWYESPEDQHSRYNYEDRVGRLIPQIDTLLNRSLTQKQFEAAVLYFKHGKTQREISEIMGISRRVVSQHLFGITRNGKSVGGAVKKLRKLCRKHGIAITN